MNYQSQSSNGNKIEQIGGKFYINGINVYTGNLKPIYYYGIFMLCAFSFAMGYGSRIYWF